jgi:trehalose-phosphatase
MTHAVLCEPFLDHLEQAEQSALLLDYDGTLAPFTVDRRRAFPYPAIPGLLRRIMETGRTRLVLITGRAAHELRPLLGLDPAPEIWGAHGLERLLPDGEYRVAELNERTQRSLAEADAWLDREGLRGLAEIKPGSIAVHWRGLSVPDVEELRAAVTRIWQPLAGINDLSLHEFDGGIELRPRARNKGDAVRSILAEIPQDAPVAYLGDDLTDEDAFRALGSRGLTLLVRPEYRATAAAGWLRPPEELVHFLTEWLRACGGNI